ncbi:hypothetical protein BJ742DRAFT_796382 [Cladochytrium replicatum]|nr:hypothetical protein BJ742DRAFT_796382 [Cladochytrium replicatum]
MSVVASPKLSVGYLGSRFEDRYPPALRYTPMTPEAYADRISVLNQRVAAVVPPALQLYIPVLFAFAMIPIAVYHKIDLTRNDNGAPWLIIVSIAVFIMSIGISMVYYQLFLKQVKKSFNEVVGELNALDGPYGFTYDITKDITVTVMTSNGSVSASSKYAFVSTFGNDYLFLYSCDNPSSSGSRYGMQTFQSRSGMRCKNRICENQGSTFWILI